MTDNYFVREFNWINEDLLADYSEILEMSLFITDTREVDIVRELLGRASLPRFDTWGYLN
jgi:hypothetical protein